MKVLLIDDMRNGVMDRIARTFDDGIKALKEEGPWDLLYLDHDLGEADPAKTGYDIMCFLEANPELLPKQIKCVSSNPVGRQKIQVVIDKLKSGVTTA